MHVEVAGDRRSYTSERRWPGPRGARTHVEVRVGTPIVTADPLADFLTARWALFTRRLGRTVRLPNAHASWPLHRAEALVVQDELLAAAGLPGVADRPPDSVLYSPGVRTRFGLPAWAQARAGLR
jgi:uncharacterized protein YqjF (DUF2071 family)